MEDTKQKAKWKGINHLIIQIADEQEQAVLDESIIVIIKDSQLDGAPQVDVNQYLQSLKETSLAVYTYYSLTDGNKEKLYEVVKLLPRVLIEQREHALVLTYKSKTSVQAGNFTVETDENIMDHWLNEKANTLQELFDGNDSLFESITTSGVTVSQKKPVKQ